MGKHIEIEVLQKHDIAYYLENLKGGKNYPSDLADSIIMFCWKFLLFKVSSYNYRISSDILKTF